VRLLEAQRWRAFTWYSVRSRRRKAGVIVRFVGDHGLQTAILVGVGGNKSPHEGIVESAIAEATQVVGACDLSVSDLPWPSVVADGRCLPYRTAVVDLVASNAVVEHVGDEADQQRFVAEHDRVGRAWVMTTPNRWFPVESHTLTLFRHWSTRWRSQRSEFTRLLSRREFRALLPPGTTVLGRPWSATFIALRPPRIDQSHDSGR